VIGADGLILGKHRKIRVVSVAEDWSHPGLSAEPITVASLRVGLLICADAYKPEIARHLHERGAQLLVSCASWAPRPY
jgi:predicted amidohydrolase